MKDRINKETRTNLATSAFGSISQWTRQDRAAIVVVTKKGRESKQELFKTLTESNRRNVSQEKKCSLKREFEIE